MRKETKVEKIETKTEVYCDICNEETITSFWCGGCERDLCKIHILEYEDDILGFKTHMCKECKNETKPYKEKAKELNKQIADLQEEWEKVCKEKYGVKG